MKRVLILGVLVLAVVLAGDIRPAPRGGERAAASCENRRQRDRTRRVSCAIGDCLACHTVRGGKQYAGGLPMATPFGTLYTPNITPDKETGIGNWTADDFRRALHEGLSKDGSYLYPAFPYNNYTRVTREDVDAMYAYSWRSSPFASRTGRTRCGFRTTSDSCSSAGGRCISRRASSSPIRRRARSGTAALTWSKGSAIATRATASATCSAPSRTTTSAAA